MRPYFAIFLLALTAQAPIPQSTIDIALDAVRNELKDPDSALFRNVSGFVAPNGSIYVCGWDNAKNSYGGYIGYEPFMVRFEGDKVASVWIPDRYTPASLIENGSPDCRK